MDNKEIVEQLSNYFVSLFAEKKTNSRLARKINSKISVLMKNSTREVNETKT